MLHVKQISDLVTQGQTSDAHNALDVLLAFGPNNVAALKIRAMLFETEGLFDDEARAWQQILKIDRHDPDALNYLFRRQMEDREHFYFTDEIAGGRRFLAYPHKIISTASYGLLGCAIFFVAVHLLSHFQVQERPYVTEGVFALFLLCVMWPWVSILRAFATSARFISVTKTEICLATRFKSLLYKWEDIEKIYLAREIHPDYPHLSLLIVPSDKTKTSLQVNLMPGESIIRARHYFLNEIKKSWQDLVPMNLSDIKIENNSHAKF